jgi:hypothetical protein
VTGSSAGSTPHAAQAARRVLLCRDIVIDTGPAQLTSAAVSVTDRTRVFPTASAGPLSRT